MENFPFPLFQHMEISYLYAQSASCVEEGARHVKTLPFLSVVVCGRGGYTVGLDGAPPVRIPEGQGFITPAGALQDITHHLSAEGVMSMRWLFLETYFNSLYRLEDLYSLPFILNREQTRVFDQLIREIEVPAQTPLDMARKNRLGFTAVERLLELAEPRPLPAPEVQPAIDYIRRHYGEELRMEQLAALCSLSPSLFLSRFKKATGQPPSAYLMQYRLSASLALVQYSQLSMGEIARQTGFYDQFYYSRCFKRLYGLSPSAYRERVKNGYTL